LGVDLALSALFQAPTLRALSDLVEANSGPAAVRPQAAPLSTTAWSPLVKITTGSPGWSPFFCVHGGGGNVVEFKPLADRLPKDIPFYGLQAQGVDGRMPFLQSIEEMAQSYVAAVRSVDSNGPYRLAGYSGGGVIAFEMAQILRLSGAEVELLAMFDTLGPGELATRVTAAQKFGLLQSVSLPALFNIAHGWLMRQLRIPEHDGDGTPLEVAGLKAMAAYLEAQAHYQPKSYAGDLLLFRARHTGWEYARAGETLGWSRLINGKICAIPVNANHHTVFKPPAIEVIARELSARLAGPAIQSYRTSRARSEIDGAVGKHEDASIT
jgi:thioesterase domain-containing protein